MSEVKFVTERIVSEITSRALPTLRNDRHRGVGIPYIKIGRSVRYDLRDVLDFMEQRKIKTESIQTQTHK